MKLISASAFSGARPARWWRAFWVGLLLAIAVGSASGRAKADDNFETARPWWENLRRDVGDPELERRQILRALALEDETRLRPAVAPENIAAWLRENQPKAGSRRAWLAAIQGRLLLARVWLNGDLATRRAAIVAAYDAAQWAGRGPQRDGAGDEPLRAAIGAAFLLPFLDLATTSASPTRAELLETLRSRFVGFTVRGEGEDERVEPVAPRAQSLDYLRLFIALAPARAANWERVYLARALLNFDEVLTDEEIKAAKAEALATLRGIEPGAGALLFRGAMPLLAQSLGQTLTPAEARDAARNENFYGTNQNWDAPKLAAWQALIEVTRAGQTSPTGWRRQLIGELARRAKLAPDEADAQQGAAVEALRNGELAAQIQQLAPARTQTDYFRAAFLLAAAADWVWSQPELDPDLVRVLYQSWQQLGRVDAEKLGFSTWRAGDYRYFPVADRVGTQLLLLCAVPMLPQQDAQATAYPRLYGQIRALTGQLARAYPMQLGRRELALKWSETQKNDPATQGEAYPDEPPRALGAALASNDLFTRWAENDNHAEWIRYDLLDVLESFDRYDDAWLVLEELKNWKDYKTVAQSLWAFHEKDVKDALRARAARPSVMERGETR